MLGFIFPNGDLERLQTLWLTFIDYYDQRLEAWEDFPYPGLSS